MPAAPMATPPFVAPPSPSFVPQIPQPQQDQGGPNFMQGILPIIAAVMAGGKDPRAVGEGLAAFQKGRSLKLAERERDDQRQMRESRDRAEFYSRLVQNAQQFDDPVAFEQFRHAVAPMLELYQIPQEALVFNSTKGDQKKQQAIVKALEDMERKNPDLAQRDDWRIVLPEYPEGVPVSVARGWRGVPMAGGQVITPTPKPEAERPVTAQRLHSVTTVGPTGEKIIKGVTDEELAAGVPAYVEPERPVSARQGDPAVSASRRFTMEQRLVSQWDKVNTPRREMRRQLGLMEAGLRRFRAGDTNGGSQAVLVTFQKILDPTSVVRESEYARTATGQSLINRIDGYSQRLAAGGAGMTDSELAAMVQTAKEFLAGMEDYGKGLRERIGRTAQEYDLDPRMIFDDALTGSEPADAAPASGPSVGTRRLINGQLGEWDGKGWKPVSR